MKGSKTLASDFPPSSYESIHLKLHGNTPQELRLQTVFQVLIHYANRTSGATVIICHRYKGQLSNVSLIMAQNLENRLFVSCHCSLDNTKRDKLLSGLDVSPM